MKNTNPDRLRSIKTFPLLIKYLRDELNWPIESDAYDDLMFDYEPEELGLDKEIAVKIKEIKQLRPLTTGQQWGIFFINFEPKRLPVVVLRRVLRKLVIKKRAGANRAQMPTWELHDLLFISTYGESSERSLTFAHFSEDPDTGELPTLRVLGWDDQDTVLHLDHAHTTLKEKLSWPDDADDIQSWRTRWSEAFTLRHREVITTSKGLATCLALLATRIRNRVNALLRVESDKGPFTQLHQAFKAALIHDLTEDDFADMYAQTITYGLLAARVSQPTVVVAENLPQLVSNPFLKETLCTFLTFGGNRGKIDFDEAGILDVVEMLNNPDTNIEAVLRDFGNRSQREDPVIHFYELFLTEYDKKKKVERGVFYTPLPVVSYIVRSVHESLQTEFGLKDGLASTVTWGEMAKRHKEIKRPKGVSANEPFVQVLDPAVGTGTFLVEVIDVVFKTMYSNWETGGRSHKDIAKMWDDYVRNHLLPRLYGYELMMAPYVIADIKLTLKLTEISKQLGELSYNSEDKGRFNIYLTNSLEPPSEVADEKLADLFLPLAHESGAVNKIKRDKRFTVVIGNPPYSIRSANLDKAARRLVEEYKIVDGERIRERNALQFEKNLQDDYVKFVRLAEIYITMSGLGIASYISNNSFLDSRSFRGMRQHLISSFPKVSVLDLHGSQKKSEVDDQGKFDENVFDIQQGVCISLWRQVPLPTDVQQVERADQMGKRSEKYEFLSTASLSTTTWTQLHPSTPFYLFSAFRGDMEAEYSPWYSLRDIVIKFSSGIKTHKDGFAYAFTDREMQERLREFVNPHLLESDLRARYALEDTPLWKLSAARQKFLNARDKPPVVPALYRPFDIRAIVYSDDIVRYRAYPTMQHLDGRTNVALLVSQQQITQGFAHAFVTRIPADWGSVSNKSRESTSAFPLLLRPFGSECQPDELFEGGGFQNNLTSSFLQSFANFLGEKAVMAREVFDYFYAILYSPSYRKRYASLLKSDFPRFPPISNRELYRTLSELGGELVALHLMEATKLDEHITKFVGKELEVGKVTYSNSTVWIDKAQTTGFKGVTENVWEFHIGGYQVCEKWLKDRKGRTLSKEDIEHYHRIIVALHETIWVMAEIDKAIDEHGGWPIQ